MLFRYSKLLIISLILSISAHLFANVGNVAKGKTLSKGCIACHGVDGNSPSPAFPKIAGQHASYLLKQLKDFKSKTRDNVLMFAQVVALKEQDMRDLSAYFATQKIKANVAQADKELLALGRKLYKSGDAKSNMPACSACHGPQGNGIASAKFPQLNFQYAQYTSSQLKAFRQAILNQQLSDSPKPARTNDANKIMRQISGQLTDLQIKALSQYIAGLH